MPDLNLLFEFYNAKFYKKYLHDSGMPVYGNVISMRKD